jgi:aspartyl-tRNA(Asn)/glutamyl-tRNA(Gln) amidotransferase subunit A
MALTELTLLDASAKLARKEVSAVELTQACLDRITQVDPKVHAFLRVDTAGALTAARAADARYAQGAPLGPLDGVPVALKDNILTEGVETTAGSKMLSGFVPPYDATVTQRLRAAGAVILGKTNLDEFAMGSSTESSAFGVTKNPWKLTHTPGGSSGGSAAAVAARECFGALGSDTGGSIRQPAALTSTVGLKPTWGRVSRSGVVAYASSLDQVGPLGRTVRDVAALYGAIAGVDPSDGTSAERPVPPWEQGLEDGVKGLRIGLPREYFVEGMDPEVAQAVRVAAKRLETLGATIVDISLPHTRFALAAYYVLATSEASSNLARYDGVRYGHRSVDATSLRDVYRNSRSEGFGPEVKRRILLGTFALSAGYADQYYVKAQKVRTLLKRDFETAFDNVDVVLSATSPAPAWPLGEKLADPLAMYLMDVLTLPCNLAGLPGLSVPCGFTKEGLPMGLQVMGRAFDEATVLRVGRAYEREFDFATRAPELA